MYRMSETLGVGEAIRSQFPVFQDKVFCDSCSKGALSLQVEAALQEYLETWRVMGSPWDLWMGKMEELRSSIASMIGAKSDEVAITTSVSASLDSLVSALRYGRRQKIIVTELEFPTVLQIWHAQERLGAEVEHVAAVDGVIPLEAFERAIDDRTLLVSATHICYRIGTKLPIPELSRLCRARGTYFLLDSYQSVGTMPVDVKELDLDFLVAGCLKYLLGPSGVAFLYVREDLIDELEPSCTGWHGRTEPFNYDISEAEFSSTARRFQSGTPSVPSIYGALAGLKIIQEVGLDRIEAHISELTNALVLGVLEMGVDLVTPVESDCHGPLVIVRAKEVGRLAQKLVERGIVASTRDDGLRISLHLYNTLGDVDYLLETFKANRSLLAP
jgi:selenocysteine lyase/cysteine desulfurase